MNCEIVPLTASLMTASLLGPSEVGSLWGRNAPTDRTLLATSPPANLPSHCHPGPRWRVCSLSVILLLPPTAGEASL